MSRASSQRPQRPESQLPSTNGTREVTPPVVIFGAPRSGTTYVNHILNAHPRVHITHETRLFVWAHRTLTSLDDPEIARTHRDQFEEYLRHELATLIRRFYAELAPNALVWGDKNPHYAQPANDGVLEMIAELYPGAKFIHVIRDGRDVVASLVRKRSQGGEPWVSFETAHRVWNSHITTGHSFAAQAAPGTVLEVRYEELIADDLAMARKMCEFVGIECHPEMIDFCTAQGRERTPMSRPTRDLGQGAEQSDWERVMSDGGRRSESLELLRENLVRFGYRV